VTSYYDSPGDPSWYADMERDLALTVRRDTYDETRTEREDTEHRNTRAASVRPKTAEERERNRVRWCVEHDVDPFPDHNEDDHRFLRPRPSPQEPDQYDDRKAA
jgi:hypothetical protein